MSTNGTYDKEIRTQPQRGCTPKPMSKTRHGEVALSAAKGAPWDANPTITLRRRRYTDRPCKTPLGFAPEGHRRVARAVRPWPSIAPPIRSPARGDIDVRYRPSRGFRFTRANLSQGLAALATCPGPSGAKDAEGTSLEIAAWARGNSLRRSNMLAPEPGGFAASLPTLRVGWVRIAIGTGGIALLSPRLMAGIPPG